METVTLYADDFKTVHNTLCDLRSVQERLTGVISNELADRLHSVVKGFERGLASAYEQERKIFDSKSDHYTAVQEEHSFRAIWSIYEVEELGQPHPFVNCTEVVYDQHWGEEDVVVPIEGVTWTALYAAADAAIRQSGDEHHIFIERFTPVSGTTRLRLSTGS